MEAEAARRNQLVSANGHRLLGALSQPRQLLPCEAASTNRREPPARLWTVSTSKRLRRVAATLTHPNQSYGSMNTTQPRHSCKPISYLVGDVVVRWRCYFLVQVHPAGYYVEDSALARCPG